MSEQEARAIALMRKMARYNFLDSAVGRGCVEDHAEARAIDALRPKPVDGAVEACREIVAANYAGLYSKDVKEGRGDDWPWMVIALAAFHAGKAHAEAANDVAEEPAWIGCAIPPAGWWCSRAKGHEGPCAARTGSPLNAGWSTPPSAQAAHDERLTTQELAVVGTALSEWAYEHLAKGYGVTLTVREVKRLLAALSAHTTTGSAGA